MSLGSRQPEGGYFNSEQNGTEQTNPFVILQILHPEAIQYHSLNHKNFYFGIPLVDFCICVLHYWTVVREILADYVHLHVYILLSIL